MVGDFATLGWERFGHDPALESWARTANGFAEKAMQDAAHAQWWDCEDTWFIGVDALENDETGRLPEGTGLPGWLMSDLYKSYGRYPLHKAQISVIRPGYPKPRSGESEAAFVARRAEELEALIRKFNADAKIIRTQHSKVAPSEILNTRLFDYERTSQSAGWIKELYEEHTPETEEYGISSFVFRERRPFHPERFWQYLNRDWPATVVRSKGLFWIASRPDDAMNWSQAGGSLRAEKAGVWWSSMPYGQRINHPVFVENKEFIESRWDADWGDRKTELVLIGQDMEEQQIRSALSECLLTDEEVKDWEMGKAFEDNWPVW